MYTVTIPFSESLAFHGAETYTDLAGAEAWVRHAVTFAPVGGGYDKTDVVIAADGFRYTLRLDIDGAQLSHLYPSLYIVFAGFGAVIMSKSIQHLQHAVEFWLWSDVEGKNLWF